MKKLIIASTICALTVLAGCSQAPQAPVPPAQTPASATSSGAAPAPKPDPAQKPEPGSGQTSSGQAPSAPAGGTPAAGTGTAPAPSLQLGWGFVANLQHHTPEIPRAVTARLQKYNAFWLGPTTSKTAYLTFDAGGDPTAMGTIMDTLKRHHIKAMFYVTGETISARPDLVKRAAAEQSVGNHTVHHLHLTDLTPAKLAAEVHGVEQQYAALTGKHLRYFRTPYGTYNDDVLAQLQAMGYRTAFWSVAMRDWEPMAGGAGEATQKVVDHLHPGAVILLHVGSKDDVAALDDIITQAEAAGYTFGDPETL